MKSACIAVIGDRDPSIVAHRGIEKSFELARAARLPIEFAWIPTERIRPGDASEFDRFCGVWCVPGSPYRSTEGALWAIELARTRLIPFLGTCGGFQHALLEYARRVLGRIDAEHAELRPDAATPLLHALSCSLVERTQRVFAQPGSRFCEHYGADAGEEGFHCSYGLNPSFETWFASSELRFTARSEDGAVRAFELAGHPFFLGTLFQPERRALAGEVHPLVMAFLRAADSGFHRDTAR